MGCRAAETTVSTPTTRLAQELLVQGGSGSVVKGEVRMRAQQPAVGSRQRPTSESQRRADSPVAALHEKLYCVVPGHSRSTMKR